MSWLPLNVVLARWLVPRLLKWGFTANQVTALSLVAGWVGCVGFVQGTQVGMVWGAVGFLVANLLDECDGSVARATGTSSNFGSWFDTIVGALVHMGFFFSLGVGLSRQTSEPVWRTAGALAALGVLLATVCYVLGQVYFRGRTAWLHPDPPRSARPAGFDRLKGGLRTDFSIVVLVAAVSGWLRWLLLGGLVGAFLFWIPADLVSAARLRRGVAQEG